MTSPSCRGGTCGSNSGFPRNARRKVTINPGQRHSACGPLTSPGTRRAIGPQKFLIQRALRLRRYRRLPATLTRAASRTPRAAAGSRRTHGYRFLVQLTSVAGKHTTCDSTKYTKCAASYRTFHDCVLTVKSAHTRANLAIRSRRGVRLPHQRGRLAAAATSDDDCPRRLPNGAARTHPAVPGCIRHCLRRHLMQRLQS